MQVDRNQLFAGSTEVSTASTSARPQQPRRDGLRLSKEAFPLPAAHCRHYVLAEQKYRTPLWPPTATGGADLQLGDRRGRRDGRAVGPRPVEREVPAARGAVGPGVRVRGAAWWRWRGGSMVTFVRSICFQHDFVSTGGRDTACDQAVACGTAPAGRHRCVPHMQTCCALLFAHTCFARWAVSGTVVWDGAVDTARCLEHWVDKGLMRLRGARIVRLPERPPCTTRVLAAFVFHLVFTVTLSRLPSVRTPGRAGVGNGPARARSRRTGGARSPD